MCSVLAVTTELTLKKVDWNVSMTQREQSEREIISALFLIE